MVASLHSLAYMHAKLLQLTLTLCDCMDCSVHGIAQARILEWVAMPSPQGIFLTQGSNPHFLCILHVYKYRGTMTKDLSPETTGARKTVE